MSYNVAFRTKNGSHAGVVTWSSYASAEAFETWYTEALKNEYDVVERGISDKRAVQLVRETPKSVRLKIALAEATNPTSGVVDEKLLEMNLSELRIIGVLSLV
jgi:hypothetical protein